MSDLERATPSAPVTPSIRVSPAVFADWLEHGFIDAHGYLTRRGSETLGSALNVSHPVRSDAGIPTGGP